MIICEFYMTRYDGEKLYRRYSDGGFYIERDGTLYEEAVDPEGTEREYTETNELFPVDLAKEDLSEITDKAEAYDILMGASK